MLVEIINTQIRVLEGLRQMKTEAQKKINQILADVWGVAVSKPEMEEMADE